MVRLALGGLARDVKADPKLVERLMALSSAAYRLAACALGTEEGAEAVVLQAFRAALIRARSPDAPRDERILFFRAVISAVRLRTKSGPARRPAEPPSRASRPGNRLVRPPVPADRN